MSNTSQVEVDSEAGIKDLIIADEVKSAQTLANDLVFKPVTSESGFMAVDSAEASTGSIVYWSLKGLVNLPQLTEAWPAELPAAWLPEEASDKTALSRACKDQAGASLIVRKHPKGGWALVHETVSETTLNYTSNPPRAYLEEEKVTFEGEVDQVLQGRILAAFVEYRFALNQIDCSGWLTSIMKAVKAVVLRDHGGMYFVPRDKMSQIDLIKKVLKTVSRHKLYKIPAKHCEDSMEGVLDGLATEADKVFSDVNGALVTSDITPAKVRGYLTQVEGVLEKVRSYERLLNTPMTASVMQLAQLRIRLLKFTSQTSLLETE